MNAMMLVKMAAKVDRHYPAARLVKNEVGNLSIVDDGEYVGYMDLRLVEVYFCDETKQ